MIHLNIIYAVDFPYFFLLILGNIGLLNIPSFPSASGLHTFARTSNLVWKSSVPSCWKRGFTSIWFTIGFISEFRHKFVKCSCVMLHTPIAFIFPSLYKSSTALQTEYTSPLHWVEKV